MKHPYKILLVENIHQVAQDILRSEGFETDRLTHSPSSDELNQLLPNYQALGIRSKTEIRSGLLQKNSHLLTVGCFCIGTNQVDLKDAKKLGIPVFNAPHSNTRSVAELVLAEIVMLSRGIFDRSVLAHQGGWLKTADGSREVRGKTIGIIGYGHIGTQVSILAEAFGMKVVFYDIIKKLPLGNARSANSIYELLAESDFVTLHVPGTAQTKNMMTHELLKKIKKGGFLLNLSRGDVVDIEGLAGLIKSGYLSGAAIDVFPKEPASNKDKFESPLQGLKNVILTPHIGGSTEEAQYAIGVEVAHSFIEFLKNGTTLGSVNFPQTMLSRQLNPDESVSAPYVRISNIHKNQPGSLGNINTFISSMGLNIVGQTLATESEIGYTLIDVESSVTGTQIDKDQFEKDFAIKVPSSLRLRLI